MQHRQTSTLSSHYIITSYRKNMKIHGDQRGKYIILVYKLSNCHVTYASFEWLYNRRDVMALAITSWDRD